jgi:hypothetical protein
MKKLVILYIFGVTISLLLTSCVKEKVVRKIGYHYITNTTGKKIVHKVICNPEFTGGGKDTFQFFSSGEKAQIEQEWVIEVVLPIYEKHVFHYWDTYFYCINDTASVHWQALWDEPLSFTTHCNKYLCAVDKDDETTENEFIETTEYYLTVNDSLLLTMQKDYAMLDKFKEYYEQK